MDAASPDPSLPRVLGAFRLLEVIGEGGMGVVYRAENVTTGDQVALKTVKRADRRMLGAMRSEIAGLRSIHHPGVVRILAEGQDDGMPWYAMQMLEGRTLSRFNRDLWLHDLGPSSPQRTTSLSGQDESTVTASSLLSPEPWTAGVARAVHAGPAAAGRLAEVLALYRALCAPLGFIHARGIIHRDMKPSNVWVQRDGGPVLMDFGLVSYAKGAIGREILGSGQKALGTLSYVSPEQIEGRLVDARADLYSFGCMLYESVTGRTPFDGSRQDILARHLSERPLAPSSLVDGIPPSLDALILGLLAKQPRQRIGHADDVAGALNELLGEPTRASGPNESPPYLYRPQLAGREDAIASLTDLWRRAEAGHGGIVLIGGESGIGKTFVTAEFAQRAKQRTVRVVTGECVPVAPMGVTANEGWAGEPLHPLRGFFHAIADACREGGAAVTDRILGDRRALLASYLPAALDGRPGGTARGTGGLDTSTLPAQAARKRLLDCLSETLSAFTEEDPVLLLIDDLQWADDLTIAFLASLPRDVLDTRRLLIVGTYRSDEVGEDLRHLVDGPNVTKLPLRRLDDSVVGSIVSDMLAIPTPPLGLTEFLARESEGNPFFVAEYLRLLVADGALERSSGQWSLADAATSALAKQGAETPRSIQGLVTRRLSRLDDVARGVVETASVLGRELGLDLLVTTTGLDPEQVAESLREAIKRQVVEPIEGNRIRFMHDKLREAAYAGIPAGRAVALHRAAAAAIEDRFAQSPDLAAYLPDLAHHYMRAGDTTKAVTYLDRAGVEAQSKSANKDAIAFFKEALAQSALLPGVDDLRRARWHRQIADALYSLGRLQESASEGRIAAGLLGWPSPTSTGRLVLSLLGQVTRQVAHRLFPKRFLCSRRHESEALLEASRAHARLLEGAYFRGHVLVMFHACLTTLNLTELANTSPELTTSYGNAFAVAGVMPARDLAETYLRRALENLQRHPDPEKESHLNVLTALYRLGLGAWDEVTKEIDRGLTLAHALRFSRRSEELWSLTSISSFLRGDLERALSSASTVCQSAIRGNLQILCWGIAEKAQALLARNQPDAALAELRTLDVHLKSAELGRTERLWVHALVARAALRRDDRVLAASAADEALKEVLAGPPISFAWIDAYAAVAETSIELWRQARVSRHVDEKRLRVAARKVCGQLKPLAKLFPAASACRGLWEGQYFWQIGQHDRAVTSWEASLASAQRHIMPHDEALALLALGTAASAGAADRRPRLEAAAAIFEKLGASYGLERARAALASSAS
ncbi:MAG: serine/threonine protein kinase [Myxococcales bacterium]|nr:serine/threonine protein kinase [Myxococcales bacterium]